MRHLGLFEGLGGFSLAARWMKWETVAWCEWSPFCQAVLKHHFPQAEVFGDITKSDFRKYENTIDILIGGFPCQPFSVSGEQQGAEDVRFLYPEMLRAIREIKPRWIVAENVRGLASRKFARIYENICASLETEGYETLPPLLIPASAIGANHERYRLWFVAHSNGKRCEGVKHEDCDKQRSVEIPTKTLVTSTLWNRRKHELPKPFVIGRNNGIPVRLDNITFSKWSEGSISGFGNAIHPGIAHEIFKAIEQFESLQPQNLKTHTP